MSTLSSKSTIGLLVACLLPWSSHGAVTDIADKPLASTSSDSVKPNIMFILDDSGSMELQFMPDPLDSRANTVGIRNGVCNTVFYNPALTYDTPQTVVGTTTTGGGVQALFLSYSSRRAAMFDLTSNSARPSATASISPSSRKKTSSAAGRTPLWCNLSPSVRRTCRNAANWRTISFFQFSRSTASLRTRRSDQPKRVRLIGLCKRLRHCWTK